jgi:hypothetical protein
VHGMVESTADGESIGSRPASTFKLSLGEMMMMFIEMMFIKLRCDKGVTIMM